MELKVPGVKCSVVKRPFDVSVTLNVEDIFVVDKNQQHGPQYELVVSSSGARYFTESPLEKSPSTSDVPGNAFVGDTASSEQPFLLNVSFVQLSPCSPDHPAISVANQHGCYVVQEKQEADMRKVVFQCATIDILGKQRPKMVSKWNIVLSPPFHSLPPPSPSLSPCLSLCSASKHSCKVYPVLPDCDTN